MTDQEHPGGEQPWNLRAKRYGIVVEEDSLRSGRGAVIGMMKLNLHDIGCDMYSSKDVERFLVAFDEYKKRKGAA